MNTKTSIPSREPAQNHAFTRIDLAVVGAMMGLMAMLFAQGNLGLSDGSVVQASTAILRKQIEFNQVNGKPAPQSLQFPE